MAVVGGEAVMGGPVWEIVEEVEVEAGTEEEEEVEVVRFDSETLASSSEEEADSGELK